MLHELANALSMISPLICWFKQRCRHSAKRMHKLMVLHIPVSFAYHMACALPFLKKRVLLVRILKSCDLIFIHIFSLIAAREVRINPCYKNTESCNFIIPKILNSICMFRIAIGNEDTMLRIVSLYTCAIYAVKGYSPYKVSRLAVTGSVACALFLLDEHLCYLGHSSFHIVLGVFQCQVFDMIQPDNLLGESNTS